MKKSILLGLGATTLMAAALVGVKLANPALAVGAVGSATKTYIEVKRLKASQGANAAKVYVYSWDGAGNRWDLAGEVDNKTVAVDGAKQNMIVAWGTSDYEGGFSTTGFKGQTANIERSSVNNNAVWVYNDSGWKGSSEANPLGTLTIDGVKQLMDLSVEENNLQHFAKVDVAVNKDITITVNGVDYGYDDLEAGCKSMFKAGAGDAFQVKSNSKYEFYWKKANSKIWAQIDSDVEADNFATDFIDGVVCDDGAHAPSTVVWGEFADRFEDMTVGGKGKFTSGSANASGTIVEQAIARYVYIVSKYNTAEVKTYEEFITRGDIVYRGSDVNVIKTTENTNDLATVVTISTLGVAAAVAAFAFLRKKKEQQ